METSENSIHFDNWFEDLISELKPAFLSNGKQLDYYPAQTVGHILVDENTLGQLIRSLLATINLFAYDTKTIDVSARAEKLVFQILIEHEGNSVPDMLKKQILRSTTVNQTDTSYFGSPATEEMLESLAKSLSGHFTTTISDGLGITYTIQLPLRQVKDDNQIAVANENLVANTKFELEPNIRYRLLIVEDNKGFREILKLELGDSYDVDSAENGHHPLALTEQNTYDIIISDIIMPEMNGLEFAESVRSSEKHQEIPFLFLTSLYHSADIIKGLSVGADAFISKPVKMDILKAHILGLLSRNQFLKNKYSKNLANLSITERVDKLIMQQLGNADLTVESLVSMLGMSRSVFYREWSELSEETVNARIMKARLNFSLQLLEQNNLTVAQVAFASGFNNTAYFTKSFKKFYGEVPKSFKQAVI